MSRSYSHALNMFLTTYAGPGSLPPSTVLILSRHGGYEVQDSRQPFVLPASSILLTPGSIESMREQLKDALRQLDQHGAPSLTKAQKQARGLL